MSNENAFTVLSMKTNYCNSVFFFFTKKNLSGRDVEYYIFYL